MIPHLPPLTFSPGVVDWQQRIDPAELRRQRAERARTALKDNGLPAALVAGPLYCRYLTGVIGPPFDNDVWYVLFPVDGDPVVFMHAGYVENMPPEVPWIREWRIARSWLRGVPGHEAAKDEARKFARDVRTELARLQLDDERLALIGFDNYARPALEDAGVKIVPGEQLLQEAMAVKTPEELMCHRMAAGITDRMWEAIVRACHAGMTESELSGVGKSVASSVGAEVARATFRSGSLTTERGFKGGNQLIAPADLIIGNVCGTSFLGYRTCVYRTFTVGREPTDVEKSWMQRLQERLLSVISELYPGNSTSAAAKHFPPASTWGYDDEAELLTIEIGHGIGLHPFEQPIVNRQWSLEHPQEVKEGMVIAVEGREGEPGSATVRLEQMVAVTKDGPRLLDRYHTGIGSIG